MRGPAIQIQDQQTEWENGITDQQDIYRIPETVKKTHKKSNKYESSKNKEQGATAYQVTPV